MAITPCRKINFYILIHSHKNKWKIFSRFSTAGWSECCCIMNKISYVFPLMKDTIVNSIWLFVELVNFKWDIEKEHILGSHFCVLDSIYSNLMENMFISIF